MRGLVVSDTQPDLFFVLRSADPTELIVTTALTAPATTDAALEGEDLSAMFGIELDVAELPTMVEKKPTKMKMPKKKKSLSRKSAHGKKRRRKN